MRNGLRYLSTAVSTARARWVNVAHPRPYSPGSLVTTLTTTSRMPAGAVTKVLTSVILIASPFAAGTGATGGCPRADERNHGSAAGAATAERVNSSRRFMGQLGGR
jgi:hypothetical protein